VKASAPGLLTENFSEETRVLARISIKGELNNCMSAPVVCDARKIHESLGQHDYIDTS